MYPKLPGIRGEHDMAKNKNNSLQLGNAAAYPKNTHH